MALLHEEETQFEYACEHNDMLQINLFVHKWTQQGDINCRFPSRTGRFANNTPLVCAVVTDNVYATELLLQHGADPDIGDRHLGTSIVYAAARQHLEISKLLLKHGANPNRVDDDECTALIWACKHAGNGPNAPEIVEGLLQHGADVNFQGYGGETSLMISCEYGHTELVRLLLKFKADPTLTNRKGESVFTKPTNADISRLLLSHKSKGVSV